MPERERQTCKQAVVIECDKVPRERELSSDCGFGPTVTQEAGGSGEDQQGGCGGKDHFTEAQRLGGTQKRKL